ncbi:hypothetical protein OPKNFCMD_5272 [Methylobacterium crusticola]|uniref:DUF6894 domain-containing protein n=1 Tax=Methylobacterium crusticola TaxID=1697972 RepID=A0ABQ4R6R3_9HYPH|nr:hypothetical protein [Methylobacterium crusticola]GJD52506.1 hypothetical protein OPKNFCMD_5272 [Methylobacterium crusticola]
MPRFFIDCQDGTLWLKDEEGEEYDTLKAARDAAIAALPDVGREAPPRDDRRCFAAYVRDEGGRRLCTVTLVLNVACRPEGG